MNDERRGRSEWKNSGVNTKETDNGCGGSGDRTYSDTICCQIVSDGGFEVRSVDKDGRHIVGYMEINRCRSKSLTGGASTRNLERGVNLLIEGEELITRDEEDTGLLGAAKFGKLERVARQMLVGE